MKVATLARSLLVAALATSAVVPGLAPEAHATTFAKLTLEQYVDASTYIVRGTVTEVWTALEDDLVWTHARVKVADTLKGPEQPREIVVSSLGGVYEDLEVVVPGAAEFSVGEENLLFLTESGPRRHLVPVGKYNGKLILRRAPGEDRLYAMTFHPDRRIAYDARFLPHLPAPQRQYLDDVLSRVQARLQAGWDGQAIPGLSVEKMLEINQLERRIAR